jgi:predicted GNAT superfamily acetyltransferase
MMPLAAHTSSIEVPAFGDSAQSLVGRELQGFDEFRAASALYVDVFQYRDPEFALNPNLLSALTRNGGSAVGVFTEAGNLIGFAYGFAGRDMQGAEFHYSQATAVDPLFQGRGVGRMLKHLQAALAQKWGHRSMRWTFDPLLAKNAHFNFETLGAVGIGYIADYYGRPGTDRLLVEWAGGEDATPRVSAARAKMAAVAPELKTSDWGKSIAHDGALWIALPAAPPGSAERSEELKARLASSLTAAFDSGHELVGCSRITEDTAAYLAVPAKRTESA